MSYSNSESYKTEYANKEGFIDILNDDLTKEILNKIKFKNPELLKEKEIKKEIEKYTKKINLKKDFEKIKKVFTVDGGFSLVRLSPKTKIAYFKIGINLLNLDLLEKLNEKEFINPSDINNINKSKVISFPFPISNFKLEEGEKSENEKLLPFILDKVFSKTNLKETLFWIWGHQNYKTILKEITESLDFRENNNTEINTTLGTITGILEQILLVSRLRKIYIEKKEELKNYLFIRDGTLSFSYKGKILTSIFRNFFKRLGEENFNINFISLEKSGVLRDYIEENKEFVPDENFLIPVDDTFARRELFWKNYYETYYGSKIIISINKKNYIINSTLPFYGKDLILENEDFFNNIIKIIRNLDFIKSFYYDDSILPIIFINKDVSISEDSKEELKKFTLEEIKKD